MRRPGGRRSTRHQRSGRAARGHGRRCTSISRWLTHFRWSTCMILVFDVGNTETTIGLFDGEALRAHWRVTSDVARTPDEIALLIRALLAADDIDRSAIDRAAIG